MNEYDLRQLNIMMQKINAYNAGKMYFPDLIHNLEALLNVLTEIDEEWKEYFRGYWWDLEQCYAVALDEGNEFFSPEDKKIITDAISNLKKMIEMKLSSNQSNPTD